jgi:hypothetical protein
MIAYVIIGFVASLVLASSHLPGAIRIVMHHEKTALANLLDSGLGSLGRI